MQYYDSFHSGLPGIQRTCSYSQYNQSKPEAQEYAGQEAGAFGCVSTFNVQFNACSSLSSSESNQSSSSFRRRESIVPNQCEKASGLRDHRDESAQFFVQATASN